MQPVEQRIAHPPNGDCLRACIASILEIEIDDLPNPVGADWADQWGEFLGPRGYSYLEISLENPGRCWWSLSDDQYWIAAVPSLNYPGCFHAVVMKGGQLVHDPSPNKKYTEVPGDIIRDMTFMVPTCVRVPATMGGGAIMLTGDFNDYPKLMIEEADMVITKTGKVVKSPDGGRGHRQATKAEIEAAEKVDPA